MSQVVLLRSNPSAISVPSCLDIINDIQFTYPLWLEDMKEMERMIFEFPNRVPSFIEGMKRKQKLFDGDRSDLVLVMLDSFQFTYPKWHGDKLDAELAYIKTPPLAKKKIECMKRKQELFSQNRSSAEIMELDSLRLTYDGHENDTTEAERLYVEYPTLFNVKIETMKRKQLLSYGFVNGNDSHDGRAGLSPPYNDGHENDTTEAERLYVEYPTLFNVKIETMKRKQLLSYGFVNGNDSHDGSCTQQLTRIPLERDLSEQLSILNNLTFTYSDADSDRKEAEKLLLNYPLLFQKKLNAMNRKQRLHVGDRSHPQVIAIDSLAFTYHGWEQDLETVMRCHCEFPAIFDSKLRAMNKKQEMHIAQVIHDRRVEQQSARKTSILKDRGTCIICLERSSTYAYVPCGHLCICETCTSNDGVHGKCPVCRKESLQLMKVFVS
eukprot:CAMPEP_0172436590 /NCGR_PEP_ID=MMETSP1064-20121228/71806_1 /TAXON_ID=202472 /ORGANISM="Aulacoseira subarctica , Strain CCAP 1002/5" /LENGTH=436 /DNA_ID=CAMNT_0013185005 /DNA_START=19 /DNA_END=1330 /DNA_ORIENTATION=-